MSELKVGMKLFHRNALGTVRECELIKIYAENSDEKIDIKLSKKIKIPRKNEKVDIFHLSKKDMVTKHFANQSKRRKKNV